MYEDYPGAVIYACRNNTPIGPIMKPETLQAAARLWRQVFFIRPLLVVDGEREQYMDVLERVVKKSQEHHLKGCS